MDSLPTKSSPLLPDLEVRNRAEETTKLERCDGANLAAAEGGAKVGLVARGVQLDQVYPRTGSAHQENRVGNRFLLKPVQEPVPKIWNQLKLVRESNLIDYPAKN